MSSTVTWKISVEGQTAIVDIPPTVKLNKETGEQINAAFSEVVAEQSVTNVLTLLKTDDPLNSDLFDEVKRGANQAAANGITRWAVVVDEKIKGMAFKSNIDGLETAAFDNEAAAREFLS